MELKSVRTGFDSIGFSELVDKEKKAQKNWKALISERIKSEPYVVCQLARSKASVDLNLLKHAACLRLY